MAIKYKKSQYPIINMQLKKTLQNINSFVSLGSGYWLLSIAH